MILELGCGTKPRPGAVNHDKVRHHDYVDVAWDLDNLPWPWADASFEEIYATDVLEHLKEPVKALEECWRILVPNGVLHLRVPYGMGENARTDLTHKSFWMPKSLDYFIRGTDFEREYGYYSKMRFRLVAYEWNKDEDNLYFHLSKDKEA